MTQVTSKKEMPDAYQKPTVYIVSEVKGYDVELVNFFQLLKVGKKEAFKLGLTGVLRTPMIGEDGIKVELTLGELVQVTIEDNPGGGIATHIANVGPSDERGMIQYAWAKSILGIGGRMKIANTDELLETEGQFRKRGIDIMKGDVN